MKSTDSQIELLNLRIKNLNNIFLSLFSKSSLILYKKLKALKNNVLKLIHYPLNLTNKSSIKDLYLLPKSIKRRFPIK